ncbi:MAG TPA: hypothetical protein VLJ42_00750 [Solirubrobacteraceae bacterium]|nr:hypothetical protein [Solirubrobacteraceae bacterium]
MQLTPLTADAARAIVDQAQATGIRLRLLGGMAVATHSPSAQTVGLTRSYGDADFITDETRGSTLDNLFETFGFRGDRRFNSMNGSRRRLYVNDAAGQIDVFVRAFEMCHKIPLEGRLEVDSPTIPLAELLLTKAQIVRLNSKDVLDIAALLLDHELGAGDNDRLNAERIAELVGADWGLHHTVERTLDAVDQHTREQLPALHRPLAERTKELRDLLSTAPKSRRWRMRARVGEKLRWYELPEDPQREARRRVD